MRGAFHLKAAFAWRANPNLTTSAFTMVIGDRERALRCQRIWRYGVLIAGWLHD